LSHKITDIAYIKRLDKIHDLICMGATNSMIAHQVNYRKGKYNMMCTN
jgi:hypothetical protein